MNGIVIIDKPEGWTSHDVVGKLRGILREKRIGHGGTLDPMATGVLPVFVGRATRAVEFCENAVKEYVAHLRLGVITDTQDTTGNVLEQREHSVTEDDLLKILPEFMGKQSQIPPMYSAVKIQGKKLYELARKGVEVERKPREITIHSLSVIGKCDGDYILRVVCSKGTYIRTLCNDIGEKLGCGGCMSYLRRTAAGIYSLSDTVTIEQVQKAKEDGTLENLLRPVDSVFAEYPAVTITGKAVSMCLNGNSFKMENTEDGTYRVYDGEGAFLMVGCCENGTMKTVKSFFAV